VMFKLKDLLPTKKERRKLFFGVCTGVLVAGIIAAVGLAVPAVRGWLGARVWDLLAFGSYDVLVRGWVIIAFVICSLFALGQLLRWLILVLRPADVRLFRSLTRNEQLIVTLLAKSEYGLTEGQLSDLVPVSTQYFLHFIDRLVDDFRLAERTEPANGGAFWTLSDKGRKVAATNGLFPPSSTKA